MPRQVPSGPPIPSSDDIRAAVRAAVDQEPEVLAATLFGSAARDAAGPLSDIDIGVLVPDREAAEAVCGRVQDALCRALGTSRVEVVALADAPPPLRYRVVRDGAVIVCRDAARWERFVVESVRQYLDFKPVRDRAFAYLRAAILETR